jgi:hypothetical protein
MENQELKHYIDEQLVGGTSPDELKKLLTHHGWAAEIVDAHLPRKTPSATPLPTSFPAPALINGINSASKPLSGGDIYVGSRKKRIWGIVLVSLPMIMIWTTVVGYAVSMYFVSKVASNGGMMGTATLKSLAGNDNGATALHVFLIALSLFALFGMIVVFVLLPIGIVLIVNSNNELKPGVAYDERSGKGDASIIPPEIGGWNWGAAFLGFWWGLYYRVWIMFISFVPMVGGVWWIVMGIKGNEWAWRQNKWQSVEHFKRSQKKWVPWVVAMLTVQALALVLYFFFIGSALLKLTQVKNSGTGLNLYAPPLMNVNIPTTEVGKTGTVVSVGADGKIFNITASDGQGYTVDINDANFYSRGGGLSNAVSVGDNVMVTGSEANGVIKAMSIIDYGSSGINPATIK